jgi:hypothetical protein
MKPGTTGTIRSGLAEGRAGMDDLQRVHVPGSGAASLQRGRHQPGAHPLASGNQIVIGAGRQLAQQAKALRQRLQLLEELADVRDDVRAETPRGEEGARHFGMA